METQPGDQPEIDYDAVAATLPVESPEQAADGLRALMENPAFRQLVQQLLQVGFGQVELFGQRRVHFAHGSGLPVRQQGQQGTHESLVIRDGHNE